MSYKRIIVKIGTSTLTGGSPNISPPGLIEIVRQISSLHKNEKQVILTTSGAMAAGKQLLNFPELPKSVPAKQMLSAVGQPHLMELYTQLFRMYGIPVAQLLLTRADLTNRRSYLNSRNTIEALLSHNVLPVVNENDTTATEEIRLGDNDNLSALIANLVEADLLILLTDQEGLYTNDPRFDQDATLITDINSTNIPQELWNAAGGTKTGLGTGGMVTKLQAANLARRSGTTVIIANGNEHDVILRIADGESIGTCFHPIISTMESRKRYILAEGTQAAAGTVIIDKGANKAIHNGGSLLAVGIVSVEGDFGRGDTIKVADTNGKKTAIGLVNYNSSDLDKLCGAHSEDIEKILGYTFGDEIIHHNNLILL